MSRLKKLLTLLILVAILAPPSVMGLAPQQPLKQALFISSLNSAAPMGSDLNLTLAYLKVMGYNTTFVADSQVTIAFLLHNLGNYSVVIWRTDTYQIQPTAYWYLGQAANGEVEQQYAADFQQGWLNVHAGIIGVTTDFIQNHFNPGTLGKVKLLIFIGSFGNVMAPPFLKAGVHTVVFCNGIISLQNGMTDDLTVNLLDYLSKGQNVQTAVYNSVSPINQYSQPQDPLDSTYPPPFWYNGDGTVTIV
jgi:hypothetical protein